MADLEKLRPDRDLQCYFERPSAIAALSETSPTGFTVSGTWRQQFDWAVLEWNRDNVFEHPLFRNLPDGDLSGLRLSYEESRTNCIPIDSDLYHTVDWKFLRIWLESSGADPYYVDLKRYATPVAGSYEAAAAEFELQGTPTAGDYITLAWMSEHHTYRLYGVDTMETAVQALVDSVNAFSTTMRATRSGARIRLTCTSADGANGNRIGVYGLVEGAKTESWTPEAQYLRGGISPTKWRIELDFAALEDLDGNPIPMNAVRKMRWTYAADLQAGAFERSEFEVHVSNWTVSGSNRRYLVAGPGSRRIEDGSAEVTYAGNWNVGAGNFSGGSIHYTSDSSAVVRCGYRAAGPHSLYLGTRLTFDGFRISVSVDGVHAAAPDLRVPGEDVLARVLIGRYDAGTHAVEVTLLGPDSSTFYFDYLEIAVPSDRAPQITPERTLTLATDWDTDHSISLAPERTAWMIYSLGFHGRANHYAGAMWFYELERVGHEYASGTIEFIGTPAFSTTTEIRIGRVGEAPEKQTVLTHVNLMGETAESVAKAFELQINSGYMAMRAEAQGNVLRIWARAMGEDGNNITLNATAAAPFTVQASGTTLEGGIDGEWRTDMASTPRLNRAARDWSRSFFTALRGYGIDAAAAFSMELQHGDPSPEAGIAQRCPDGDPVWLNTPALQTNFSPESTAFWQQVYRDMAQVMADAGMTPYLQFGEVQWWYFRDNRSGMPFYDAYTRNTFRSIYGREIGVILSNDVPVSAYPEEAAFLPSLIGNFTTQVIDFVRQAFPQCRFEVLYPTDVNDTAFNRAVNLPAADWSPDKLDCFKTESFTYTYGRNLNKSADSIAFPTGLGFTPSKRSHLVGISDPIAAWQKEVDLARAQGLGSVVLFALDQFALIGYPAPLPERARRSLLLGK